MNGCRRGLGLFRFRFPALEALREHINLRQLTESQQKDGCPNILRGACQLSRGEDILEFLLHSGIRKLAGGAYSVPGKCILQTSFSGYPGSRLSRLRTNTSSQTACCLLPRPRSKTVCSDRPHHNPQALRCQHSSDPAIRLPTFGNGPAQTQVHLLSA